MSLLTNLYNSVAKFFRSNEEPGDASKSVATNRLKLVLMQDRTNLTPRILEQMRSELIELLSRYVELDKELLDLNFEQEGDQVALMLSIPVIRAKDEEEIDAAIKEREETLAKLKSLKIEAIEIEETSEDAETEETSEEEKESDAEVSAEQDKSDDAESAEEVKADAKKNEAIADELNNIPKIIKKSKVSAPEEMVSSNSGNNPFKPEELDKKIESPKEA